MLLHRFNKGGVLIAVGLLLLFAQTAAAQTFTCFTASEWAASNLRDLVVRLVTASPTDTLLVSSRDLYMLPSGSASSVSVETKRQKCQAAAQAYHSVLHPGQPQVTRKVVVINVGNTRYIVLDPTDKGGEFEVHVVFDSQWTVLASFEG